ncbi:MAG: hypothetical protein ACOYN4_02550 [Bacteroidales bacterium]
MISRSRKAEIYFLVFLVAIQSVAALYGGLSMITDPSGSSLQLEIQLLQGSMFNSYIIPGLVLFILLGLFPFILIYPLLFKPKWELMNLFNIYSGYYWAWTYTLYTAIMLIIWINVQFLIIGSVSKLQGYVGLYGVLILIVTLMPRVRRYFKVQRHSRNHTIVQK